MDPMFFYLIGVLIGFGISYSTYDVAKAGGEQITTKKGPFLLLGAVLSWLTVLLFIWGFLSAFLKNDDEDGE